MRKIKGLCCPFIKCLAKLVFEFVPALLLSISIVFFQSYLTLPEEESNISTAETAPGSPQNLDDISSYVQTVTLPMSFLGTKSFQFQNSAAPSHRDTSYTPPLLPAQPDQPVKSPDENASEVVSTKNLLLFTAISSLAIFLLLVSIFFFRIRRTFFGLSETLYTSLTTLEVRHCLFEIVTVIGGFFALAPDLPIYDHRFVIALLAFFFWAVKVLEQMKLHRAPLAAARNLYQEMSNLEILRRILNPLP